MSPIRAAGWAQSARSRTNTQRSLFTREELCSIRDENNARNTNLPALINQISDALQKQPRIHFADFELIYSHNAFFSRTQVRRVDCWMETPGCKSLPCKKEAECVRPYDLELTSPFNCTSSTMGQYLDFLATHLKLCSTRYLAKQSARTKRSCVHNQHDLLTPFCI